MNKKQVEIRKLVYLMMISVAMAIFYVPWNKRTNTDKSCLSRLLTRISLFYLSTTKYKFKCFFNYASVVYKTAKKTTTTNKRNYEQFCYIYCVMCIFFLMILSLSLLYYFS